MEGERGKRKAELPPATAAAEPERKKPKKDTEDSESEDLADLKPGFLSSCRQWYCCKNGETLVSIASKLGMEDWKAIAAMPQNPSRYGPIGRSSFLRKHTLLAIPTAQCSPWKLQQLQRIAKQHEMGDDNGACDVCTQCGLNTEVDEESPVLLCDGCNSPYHLKCLDISSIPTTDWFCSKCIAVFHARKQHKEQYAKDGQRPLIPPLEDYVHHSFAHCQARLKELMTLRRDAELTKATNKEEAAKTVWENQKKEATENIERLEKDIQSLDDQYKNALDASKKKLGVKNWSLLGRTNDFIELLPNKKLEKNLEEIASKRGSKPKYSKRWGKARGLVERIPNDKACKTLVGLKKGTEAQLRNVKKILRDGQAEYSAFSREVEHERWDIQVKYASLMGERLVKAKQSLPSLRCRETEPGFLGQVKLQKACDVRALNMLREPDELILTVPMVKGAVSVRDMEPKLGLSYAIFAMAALFDRERDDELPWKGVREAQGRLFRLLQQSDANSAMLVRKASIPTSVRLRKTPDPSCFDLSNLVKDCNVDLDLPRESTPSTLPKLRLHEYQQSSLRFMVDKEKEEAGLGLAGEFWHRLRFLDDKNEDYYFCELTSSFSRSISDSKKNVDQSIDQFSLPTGGILGLEMGLGKTLIVLALIEANPPPNHLRVLPLENMRAQKRGESVIDHPDYVPPPIVPRKMVSNGTLVVCPLSLLSQWLTEVGKFAPHLNVMVLHNEESPKANVVASTDVVVVSTFLLQQTNKKTNGNHLLNIIKRIHWHRICVDEAHMNNSGQQTRTVLSSLSATHRHLITGTPIGAQLSDLFGQLRFLRIAPFCRPAFWKNLIEDPYYGHHHTALQALRLLLSHVVVRHSKCQHYPDGKPLIMLPQREVETVLLRFETEEEQNVYDFLEQRNMKHFSGFKSISKAFVASKYIDLYGMLTCVRQLCGHSLLVSVEKLHRFQCKYEKQGLVKKHQKTVESNKTREEVFSLALRRARMSAKTRMRLELNKFRNPSGAEESQCPICLDVFDERETALPPCAHPCCMDCTSGLLDQGTSTREPSGKCPICREKMVRSEITFLGEAIAKVKAKTPADDSIAFKPSKATVASVTTHGFRMQQLEVRSRVGVAEALSLRSTQSEMTEAELTSTLHDDQALLHTLNRTFLGNLYTSERRVGTKMAKLLKEINEMMARNNDSKCVVFSQYNGVLDVAAEELYARSIRFVRIDGNRKQHERADALTEFSSNPDTRVFLLSMKSGAMGLNLIAADHCFIYDTCLNSAIEEQAIDRIHRIGQEKNITIKRFVMQGTIEERLMINRRALGADQEMKAGTDLCGTHGLDVEEKVARKNGPRVGEADQNGDNPQQARRVALLEKLFGCTAPSTGDNSGPVTAA